MSDQLAIARRHADAHHMVWLEDYVYTDAALSGSSLDRPGIRALRDAALRRPRPFDVVLVDDSSRVSRDLADAVRLLQELKFAGVRVIYISQGIDSTSEQAEALVGLHGIMDGFYLKEMASKIKRGLAGQLERGFATGAITFGYRTVPVPDPSGKTDVNGYPVLLGKRVEIVPDEARTVRDIFELYASGMGTGRLVERLNQDGRKGPRGRVWRSGAVTRILVNEKYRGRLIWGKTTQERRPGTRQYVERHNPRDQWRVLEQPELRIVSDDLWARVQARRAAVKGTLPERTGGTLMRGRNAALHSPHLFSGFLKCGVCGGAVTIVTGGHGSPRYGCLVSQRNGTQICRNRATARAKVVDAALLEALHAELLAPSTVRYITDTLATALNQRIDQRPTVLAEARIARQDAHARLQRLIDAIQQGVPAASLAAAITARQAEIARLNQQLDRLDKPLTDRLAVMPAWVQQELKDLVALLSMSPERTKAEFQRLGVRVTMHPMHTEGGRSYYRAEVVSALPCLSGTAHISPKDFPATGSWDPPARP